MTKPHKAKPSFLISAVSTKQILRYLSKAPKMHSPFILFEEEVNLKIKVNHSTVGTL